MKTWSFKISFQKALSGRDFKYLAMLGMFLTASFCFFKRGNDSSIGSNLSRKLSNALNRKRSTHANFGPNKNTPFDSFSLSSKYLKFVGTVSLNSLTESSAFFVSSFSWKYLINSVAKSSVYQKNKIKIFKFDLKKARKSHKITSTIKVT